MKKTLFILCCILLLSCSKKLYYAYENTAEGSYCTFEVNKKDIIYRAVSTEHYVTNSYPTKEYVYIVSNNGVAQSEEPKIDYGSLLLYLNNTEINLATVQEYLEPDGDFLFYLEKKDSLKLIKNDALMKNEVFFKNHDLFWFPPYLKQVDKIEYDKFNLPYKKKNLRRMQGKDLLEIEKSK